MYSATENEAMPEECTELEITASEMNQMRKDQDECCMYPCSSAHTHTHALGDVRTARAREGRKGTCGRGTGEKHEQQPIAHMSKTAQQTHRSTRTKNKPRNVNKRRNQP